MNKVVFLSCVEGSLQSISKRQHQCRGEHRSEGLVTVFRKSATAISVVEEGISSQQISVPVYQSGNCRLVLSIPSFAKVQNLACLLQIVGSFDHSRKQLGKNKTRDIHQNVAKLSPGASPKASSRWSYLSDICLKNRFLQFFQCVPKFRGTKKSKQHHFKDQLNYCLPYRESSVYSPPSGKSPGMVKSHNTRSLSEK